MFLKSQLIIFTLALIFGMSGCGGSSGDDNRDSVTTADLNGIYSGSFTNEEGDSSLFALIYQGLIFAFSEDAMRQYSGTAQGRNADFFMIYGLFDGTGTHLENGEAQGAFTPHDTISADYLTTEPDVGEITLNIDPIWNNPASLNLVAGNYTLTDGIYQLTVNINIDGSLNGSDTDGCVYEGTTIPPESEGNIYIIEMTQAVGCRGETEEVDILGFGTLYENDGSADELLVVMVAESTQSNDEYMWTLNLQRP